MPKGSRKPLADNRGPSLRGLMVVDATRGSLRIRAWPRKRSGTRDATNTYWTDWLRAVTFLYRYQPAKTQASLARATAGTPWMPRDIFISAARGRAWAFTAGGRTYYPMPYRVDVSRSLDALAQLEGQMLYRSSGLWAPIDPGSTPGQALTWVGPNDPPSWQTPSPNNFSGCIARKSATQSCNNNTTTFVTFDTEDVDTDGYHSNVSNTTRFTVPTTANYYIACTVEFDANATGQREIFVRVNGGTDWLRVKINATAAGACVPTVSGILPLTAGDYVEAYALQNSGGTRTLANNRWGCRFQIQRLG